jgi:glycosyltransferase involved in cell wall biosynthesis
MPRISILIPCYNASHTLNEAIESMLNQTFTDFEIIAVDDDSEDNTKNILEDWAIRDHRVKVFSKDHSGIIETLNYGLKYCTAEYIARMDADDRSHHERLAEQIAFLDAHSKIGLVSCLVKGFPQQDVREGFRVYIDWLNSLKSNHEIQRELYVESPFPHPSVVFRKQVILEVGGYQEHGWAEDYDLWLRMAQAGIKFAKVPSVCLEWREHPERLTRKDSRYSLENFLRAKAYYLMKGPISGRDAVIIWGAGMMGRRLSKQLNRQGAPLVAFIDIDPKKIGHTKHHLPILSPDELTPLFTQYHNPVLLSAVGARGARNLIREKLNNFGFVETLDWWSVA